MGQLVAFGGALFPEKSVRPFAEMVDSIAESCGIPARDEIKWSPKKGSWIRENLVGDARTDCYRQIISAARELGIQALVIVWDTGRTTLKGEKAFEKCLDFAFERLSVNLSKRNEHALIIADRPGGGKKEEASFLENFLNRVESGTEYSMPEWCSLNVLTTPSKLLRQLQLADLITGITTAMVAGQYKYAAPLFEEVKPMLLRNYDGTIGGTGLKVFPDSLWNLYHWVLGEEVFWKVRESAGIELPMERLPYATDDARS
ncbi:MAG: hypothetical protein UZ17_ACD001001655 [Acidobacteria bacterium OLB17]|nr:MAG: hypothetical protein UZ17_ACD001001655 [Acidobacteria bacterium OLB17]